MMTTTASLAILERAGNGTGPARSARRQGFVPGVLYGKTQTPMSVQIEQRFLVKEMKTPGFTTRIYSFDLGGKTHQALLRAIQLHPVSDMPLHFDLMEVNKNSRIHLQVPLHFLNEDKCPGLKKNGVLNQVYHSVDVYCSPANIPEHLDVDLAEAEIGFTLHFRDLVLPTGVSFVHENLGDTIMNIVPPKVAGSESEEVVETPEVAAS